MLTKRRSGVLAVLVLVSAAAVVFAAARSDDPRAELSTDGSGSRQLVIDDIEPLPDPGRFTDLATEQETGQSDGALPWTEYAAVRPCPEIAEFAGLPVDWFDAVSDALRERGKVTCSFQTPEITTVGADRVQLSRREAGEFELQATFWPDGHDPATEGLVDLFASGGVLITIDIGPEGVDLTPDKSEPAKASGGYALMTGGLPDTTSVLSRPTQERYLLRWPEQADDGSVLRVSIWAEHDVEAMLQQLGVQRSSS
jgi:hypothetical protein